MQILQVNNVTKRFDGVPIFTNVSMNVENHARIGLVGRNGAGKSTLVKMIIGEESVDAGTITEKNGLTVGYLSQNTGLHSEQNVWDEMLSVFAELIKTERKMHALEQQMSDQQVNQDPNKLAEVTKSYDTMQANFTANHGYSYQAEIKAVLNGFGFGEEYYDQPVNSLSGGQQTQLALAKLLLEKRDLLILDEPTNHLDVETITWLEGYVQNYPGALLIISHDRYFMDKLVNEVYDLDNGSMTYYKGDYTSFVKQKQARYAERLHAYEKQQAEIKKMKDFIDKNIVRASTTNRAQARRKQLAKMHKLEKPFDNNKVAQFRFTAAKPSGNIVLTVRDLAVGYDGNVIASPINIDEKKHQSIAIIGPNGVGKSTLLKTILGQQPKLAGTVTFGTGVTIGYYDQKQESLHSDKTVLNEIWDDYPTTSEGRIRTILGSFLFSGNDVEKVVGNLSGGEKARLMLTKLAMDHDNFLMLDEPTNHLDIESREVLETALKLFDGTILFVSHDRYFINQVASEIIEITPDGSQRYLGNYDYYVEKKEDEIAQAKHDAEQLAEQHPEQNQPVQSKGRVDYQQSKQDQKRARKLKRQISDIEAQMGMLSKRHTEIEDQMAHLASAQKIGELNDLQTELEQINQQNEELSNQWTELSLELETLES
ncbi:ABC-F family ATP-binding cassette domain-containing protein [Nicoliella spurrieriana]|uniref:ABC-F family ATP-binding cassette domain-containing protein n=1 Tax=Nicoliella spurrieriana TaxID=2925830 RepID=A0A976RSI3_9LACO|nr:ABC-F family ATP-binding cassette domain-containing protein [Nicoliella spurrieriana]UQS86993.1 ABC-F family ATP-binding cassette domain-containing protein [Nicoliella spurrieriana]